MSGRVSITASIVEDDPMTRRILADWLQATSGFRRLSDHPSAEDALERLPALAPQVVLMDINLPGQSGIQCVGQLKPLLPATQFVMLTVYEDVEHIFEALSAGASGYLLKKTPRAELFSALRDVHAGGSPMSSKIARKVVQAFQRPTGTGVLQPDASNLAPREVELLGLLAQGHSYKEIADTMGIAVGTVNTYVRRIYEKLHVHSRAQAVAKCRQVVGAPHRPAR